MVPSHERERSALCIQFTKKPVPDLEGFDCACAKPADITDARIPQRDKSTAQHDNPKPRAIVFKRNCAQALPSVWVSVLIPPGDMIARKS